MSKIRPVSRAVVLARDRLPLQLRAKRRAQHREEHVEELKVTRLVTTRAITLCHISIDVKDVAMLALKDVMCSCRAERQTEAASHHDLHGPRRHAEGAL